MYDDGKGIVAMRFCLSLGSSHYPFLNRPYYSKSIRRILIVDKLQGLWAIIIQTKKEKVDYTLKSSPSSRQNDQQST
jgi:hypothetical protein